MGGLILKKGCSDDADECSRLVQENTRRMLKHSKIFAEFGLIIRKFFIRSRLFPFDLSLFLRSIKAFAAAKRSVSSSRGNAVTLITCKHTTSTSKR
jgi:hypothetical protein